MKYGCGCFFIIVFFVAAVTAFQRGEGVRGMVFGIVGSLLIIMGLILFFRLNRGT